jgi:putative two-component system response regulator
VGKIAIRDKILLKPSTLTSEEFEQIKLHTTFGERIIDLIQQELTDKELKESILLGYARIMAGMHHEKWDGSGYPRGVAGSNIPLQGRLMALVDVYEALVSERPYKKAFPPEEALRIIKEGSGVQFEPVLVDIFIAVAPHFVTWNRR